MSFISERESRIASRDANLCHRLMREDRLIAAAVITSLSAVSVFLPRPSSDIQGMQRQIQAAQAAGTTRNLKYADYRKAEFGTGASLTPIAGSAATPAPAPAAAPSLT